MAEPEIIAQPTLRVVAPKPRMTIYYALLIIALLAMLTACIFLYMVIRTFGGFGAVQGRVSSLVRPASVICHREHRVHREIAIQASLVNSVSAVATS
jgi:hypothetical protein